MIKAKFFFTAVLVLFPLTDALAAGSAVGERIAAALDSEKDLGRYSIDIEGRAGLVILTGEVSSEAAKDKIEQVARNIAKGDEVRNLLTVNQEMANAANLNAQISSAVARKLAELKATTRFSVEVGIRGDELQLKGEAATLAEKERIEDQLRSVPGVKNVVSEILVTGYH